MTVRSPVPAPSAFEAVFGVPPDSEAAAPGRVNLLGEHTDYNDGFVLPIAIPQRTRVAMRPNGRDRFRLHAQELGQAVEFTLDAAPAEHFATYVFGCLAVARLAGAAIAPLDIHVASDVPMGVGLSSSAALEVATLRCLRQLLGLTLDDVQVAQMAQRAEIDYAGVRCGILDQMASSLADTTRALLLDTRSLERRFVPLPPDSAILVIDSGMPRSLAASAYNLRRAECEQAASLLGVASLRDVPDALAVETLPEPMRRRARHVLTENARVLQAVDCASAQDFGVLMNASHASLRDDYEVSIPELDRLVSLLQEHPDVFGARLTGAGALDTGFGTGGFVTSGVSGGYGRGSAVTVDGSDRVLVCGWGDDGSGLWRVVRLTAAGAFDASFGTGGIANLRDEIEAGNCSALALQPDGKILLGGSVSRDDFLACGLMRLNADGTEDTLFGSALTISAGAATLGPLVADGTLATAVVLDAGSATLGPLVAAGELYLSLLLSPGAAAIGLTAAGTITLTNAPLQAGSATLGPLTAAGALAISRPIPPHVLATRYSLTLTGAADGLPDAALPLANWQSVARLVGSTYLTCTVPLSSAVEAAILARPHGTLIVRQHLIYASETITAEIVAAPWDAAPRIDEGGRSASITLAGLAPQPARAPKSVTLRGVSYRRLDGGVTVRSAIDLFAAPGDTLDYGDGDLVADQITYICTPGAEWMEARSDG